MSNLPPWWRQAGGILAVVLLFIPGAQLVAIVYLAVYLGALIVTRGSRADSTGRASRNSSIEDGLFMRFMTGFFPYSLMFLVGLVIMIGFMLDSLFNGS